MQNNITRNLSAFGFSNYELTIDGRLFKTAPAPKELKKDNISRFYIIDDCGNSKRITLKQLYKKAYNKEFCIDETANLCNEEWKEIENTDGKYLVSNYGRVKSLCGYTAIILQPYQKHNGYLIVKINGKNMMIHRLVAFAFCENKYKGQTVEIHHKDFCRSNNTCGNLEILTPTEHRKRHSKKEKADNEAVLY